MLDHLLVHFITSLRESFESALLQRQAVEERFQVDVFLGDVSFETSYSLPGEQRPARIRVDISLDWPTWSQTSYRSWSIDGEVDELPEMLVEVAFRVQGLDASPTPEQFLSVLPEQLEALGDEALVRGAATVEQVFNDDPRGPEFAIEVSYEGTCQIEERFLEHPDQLGNAVAPLGRSVASILVRVGDLPFAFRPTAPSEH